MVPPTGGSLQIQKERISTFGNVDPSSRGFVSDFGTPLQVHNGLKNSRTQIGDGKVHHRQGCPAGETRLQTREAQAQRTIPATKSNKVPEPQCVLLPTTEDQRKEGEFRFEAPMEGATPAVQMQSRCKHPPDAARVPAVNETHRGSSETRTAGGEGGSLHARLVHALPVPNLPKPPPSTTVENPAPPTSAARVAVATPLEVMTSSAMATDCSDGGEAATEAVPMEAGVGGSHSPNIGDVITAPVSGQVVKSVEEVVSKQLQLMMDRLPPEERTKWLLEAAQVRYTQIP
jgi:hypothetical protein